MYPLLSIFHLYFVRSHVIIQRWMVTGNARMFTCLMRPIIVLCFARLFVFAQQLLF